MTRLRRDRKTCDPSYPGSDLGLKSNFRAVQVGLDYLPSSGGTTTAISQFREALGGDIVSFTSLEGVAALEDQAIHVPLARGPVGKYYGWSRVRSSAKAERCVASANLVVIHGLFRHHCQWAWKIARRENIPYWIVPHGGLDPWVFSYRVWQKRTWMTAIGKRMIDRADAVIYATAREVMKAKQFVDTSNSHVVHWSVDLPRQLSANDRRRSRERLGLQTDTRIVLFLGRLHPSKRVAETIAAAHQCSDKRLRLIVVGPDSPELTLSDCQRLVASLDESRIEIRGAAFGTEKADYFRAADAFVSLSRKENFGFTVAEALSFGLPVILSPGNDLAPELEPVGCGWLLRSFDLEEATQALSACAALPSDELAEMGRRGRTWAALELSEERFRARLVDLAETAVAPR